MNVSIHSLLSSTYQVIKAKFEAGLTPLEKKIALLAVAYFACAAIGYFILSYWFYAHARVKRETKVERVNEKSDILHSPSVSHEEEAHEKKIETLDENEPPANDNRKLTISERLEKNARYASKQQEGEASKGFKLELGEIPSAFSRKPLVTEKSKFIKGNEVSCVYCEGNRPSMEDEHLATEDLLEIKGNQYPFELYGVFDGHGGKEASQFLKLNLLTYLKRKLENHNPDGLTKGGIFGALKECFQQLSEDYTGFDGSTATIALVLEGEIWIANVGDSRTVLIQNGAAIQASEDAKPKIPRYKNTILKLGGDVFNGRVMGKINVARAVGDKQIVGYDLKRCCVSSKPKITCFDADVEYIVLACDGIYEIATTNDVATAFAYSEAKGESLAEQTGRFVFSVLNRGSTDNVTALVVRRKASNTISPARLSTTSLKEISFQLSDFEAMKAPR